MQPALETFASFFFIYYWRAIMAIVIRGLGKALPLKEMKNTDFPT